MAYGVETHANMSQDAAQASVLGGNSPNGVLQSLGLNYPIRDLTGTQVFPNSKGQPKDIQSLIMDGARFEDNGIRSLNHFYDPTRNTGLIDVIPGVVSSPDWALEDTGQHIFPIYQGNSFTDARGYLYQALTAKSKADHDKYFGYTFQTLGQVIHHIQDMAQPQHVRNDAHCEKNYCVGSYYNPSRYESYSEENRDNKRIISYSGYDPVFPGQGSYLFDTARKFWTTGDGRGMAEFTNHNFVSAGTNYQLVNDQPAANQTYPDPGPTGFGAPVPIQDLYAEIGETTTLTGVIGFVQNDVVDSLTGTTTTNTRSASYSIYDQYLKTYGVSVPYTDPTTGNTWMTNRLFTLNVFNFNAEYPLLIPKAVGYSAGLINYFFRGRLAAEQASFSDDGTTLTVTLKLKNSIEPSDPAASADVLYAQSGTTPSTFTLAVQYILNGQDQYAASDPVPIDPAQDSSIAPDQVSNQSFTFGLPSIPAVATDVQFHLVFKGRLGQEDGAVAVGRVEPVSGFAFVPNYLPADGIGGSRVIEKQGGAWRLSSERGLQAGNVDWKGGYVGDMPTKVLSWMGPPSRYFPSADPYHKFDIVIFQDGQDFAYAPYPVLGAAIAQDAAGREWLVAICTDGSNDIVYRRPNKRSDSPDLYDPVSNPDGWREIGRFSPPPGMSAPDRPWFFNGTGTEAQTMRPDNSVLNNGLTRLKMSLDAADLTVTAIAPIPNLSGDTYTEYSSPSSWTISPPPTLPPCSAGAVQQYSDSALGEISYGNSEVGEYIIAVDYTASGEITATYRVNATTTATETYDQQEQVTINCGPPQTESKSATLKAKLKVTGQYQDSLSLGEKRVILVTSDHTLDRSEDTQSTEVTGSPAQVTSQYDSVEHLKNRVANFVSLDLRYGLVVVNSDTFDDTYTASGPDAYAPINGESTQSAATDIHTATQNIPVYSGAQSSSWTVPGSGNAAILTHLGPVGSVVPGDQKTYGPIAKYPYPDPNIAGSWAIDAAGDLFVSQNYRDSNGSYHQYNYLSGGDLTQLVPPAPPNALYDPIGVIH
jgi:hypothetical protein